MTVTSEAEGAVVPMRGRRREPNTAAVLTVKDLADASGLPQPVIAQLVPHTETAEGRLYTDGQLRYAVELAQQIRSNADT